ncbi:MAG: glycosyltransferase family 4 protein [Candidatus Vogelbacteria bacterium]
MKILIATPLYPPDIGGPATYSKLLFDELPKKGVEVLVLSFGEVRTLPKIIRHIIYFFKLLKKAHGVDIIFAQDTASVGFPSLWVSKILAKRFFVRVPGDYTWEQSTQRFGVVDSIDEFQDKRYGWRVEFLRKIQKITVNGADTVIAPSQYFRQLVSRWVKNPSKVFCIYNGIDLSAIPEPSSVYEPKTIISAGRLVPWKGFSVLIMMMCSLPGWKLSIAGDGPMRKELENVAIKSGVSDRVFFLGQIPRKELIQKIQNSEVFVLNTSFESFSFQIVEAMAAGTPVITTNIGNLSEIIDNGKSGILITLNDGKALVSSIEHLSSDKIFREKIITEARKKSQQFSIENTLNNLLIHLKKI